MDTSQHAALELSVMGDFKVIDFDGKSFFMSWRWCISQCTFISFHQDVHFLGMTLKKLKFHFHELF